MRRNDIPLQCILRTRLGRAGVLLPGRDLAVTSSSKRLRYCNVRLLWYQHPMAAGCSDRLRYYWVLLLHHLHRMFGIWLPDGFLRVPGYSS